MKSLPGLACLVQDFTWRGLFQHLKVHDGRALLAHSEMSSSYDLILKKHQEAQGERQLFCRLYDGTAEWALTSATSNANDGKGKRKWREVLPGNALTLSGFTQPGPLLQLFMSLAKAKDGFLDRILICSIKPRLLHEVETWCKKLDEYTTQDITGMMIKIKKNRKQSRIICNKTPTRR